MQRHIILLNSITYAIKGRDLLRKQGFRAYIERKTNNIGNSSCGYVIIANGNKNKIIRILAESGIKIINVDSIA